MKKSTKECLISIILGSTFLDDIIKHYTWELVNTIRRNMVDDVFMERVEINSKLYFLINNKFKTHE